MHNLHKRDTEGSETSHFNELVPQAVRDKMLTLVKMVKDDFISDATQGWHEAYGCSNITAIYGYHISGFIPSQLGAMK